MSLTHVYIYRPGDREIILNYLEGLQPLSDQDFMEKVNSFASRGLFGVHQQALYFIALWKEAKNRGLKTALKVENNCLLSIEEPEPANEIEAAERCPVRFEKDEEKETEIREKGRAFLDKLKAQGPNLDKVGKAFIFFKYKFKK